MSEKDSEKYVFSYMDGIPVKISEKYKPPRKIVLPVGFQNRLLQPPVSAEYDFQLEHDVLDKLHQWQSMRLKEKEKRRQRIRDEDSRRQEMQEKLQELEETLHELSTDVKPLPEVKPAHTTIPDPLSTSTQQSVEVQSLLPTACLPIISEVNPILRPIPIKHHVVASQINNNKPISAFNLSDFEADTSSPFDNVELKTINDFEELAQVLQRAPVKEVPSFYQNTIQSDECFQNSHQTMNHNHNQVSCVEEAYNPPGSDKVLNDAKSGVNFQPHVNGYALNYDYNNVPSYHPQSVIPHLNPQGQTAAYNLSHPSEVSFGYQHPDTQFQSYYNSSVWPSVELCQVARYEPQPFNTPAVNSTNIATVTPNVPIVKFQYPSSSSLDQPQEKSEEDNNADLPINLVAQQLSNLMKSRSSKSNNSNPCEKSTSDNNALVESANLPSEEDTVHSLNSESQLLVKKIAEMGFPRARVARACLSLGCNDKKIIEFLLSLQSLLDAGYREEYAEHALSLHKQDVDAAAKFLQVESQLLDLGFPRDRVSEALIKFKCDRDQALEFLIS